MVAALAGAGIGAGIGNLIGNIVASQQKGGDRYYRAYLNNALGLQTPDLIERQFPATQLERVSEFTPTLYDPSSVENPELVGQQEQQMLDQQIALQQMQQIAQEGVPIQDTLASRRLGRGFADETQRARDATLRRFQAQGRASGGDQLAAELIGQQQSSNQLRDQGEAELYMQAQRRQQAIMAVAQMSGQQRDQGFGEEAYNKSTVNRFNDLAKARMTQAARDNAMTLTQGQALNAAEAQRLSDENAYNRANVLRENVYGPNSVRQQEYGNELKKQQLLAGALTTMGGYKDEQGTAKANLAKGVGTAAGGLAGQGIGSLFARSGAQPATAGSAPLQQGALGQQGGQDPFSSEPYKLRWS